MQNTRKKGLFYYLFCCFCCPKPEILSASSSSPENPKKIEILTHNSHIKLEVLPKNPDFP